MAYLLRYNNYYRIQNFDRRKNLRGKSPIATDRCQIVCHGQEADSLVPKSGQTISFLLAKVLVGMFWKSKYIVLCDNEARPQDI
jgi:hypothetical protein